MKLSPFQIIQLWHVMPEKVLWSHQCDIEWILDELNITVLYKCKGNLVMCHMDY